MKLQTKRLAITFFKSFPRFAIRVNYFSSLLSSDAGASDLAESESASSSLVSELVYSFSVASSAGLSSDLVSAVSAGLTTRAIATISKVK